MILIINEKPSQARNFSKALGGMSGAFNGESYQITSLRGHVYEFITDPKYQVDTHLKEKYKSWDLSNLPWKESDLLWNKQKIKGTSSLISDVVALSRKASEICIATDDDPSGEGQLLAGEVLVENNIRPKKLTRMYFSDESEKSIRKAFKERKTLDSNIKNDGEYKKALFRSKWDYMSMQWSRIATKLGDGKSVLRQGRLKSAMVYLVAKQLDDYNSYKKIPFYVNKFKDENGNIFSNKNEKYYKSKNEVPNVYKDGTVEVLGKKALKKAPPKLIDLSTLASRLAPLGIDSKTVLATYQKMYEAKVVSYPRTEDKYITEEQFNELLPLAEKIAKLVGVDSKLLVHKSPRKTHIKDGMAHGANRPGLNVPITMSSLSQYGRGAKEIYEILALSYLSMLCDDYKYYRYDARVKEYPDFISYLNIDYDLGWKKVYNDDDDEESSDKMFGKIAKVFIHEGFPPRPVKPNMKWLMKELGKYNIGTGATRTSTYGDVTNTKTKYPLLKDKKGKIEVTDYGNMSYVLLENTHIGNLELTKALDKQMKDVEMGKYSMEKALNLIEKLIVDDMKTMEENSKKLRKKGIKMANFEQKPKYEGIWAENGENIKFNKVWGTDANGNPNEISDEDCEKLLAGEEVTLTNLKSKTDKIYNVTGKLKAKTFKGHDFVGFEPIENGFDFI